MQQLRKSPLKSSPPQFWKVHRYSSVAFVFSCIASSSSSSSSLIVLHALLRHSSESTLNEEEEEEEDETETNDERGEK
jgi:hypothetical protein